MQHDFLLMLIDYNAKCTKVKNCCYSKFEMRQRRIEQKFELKIILYILKREKIIVR